MSVHQRWRIEVRAPNFTLAATLPVRWTPEGYIVGYINESFWLQYEKGSPFIDTRKAIPERAEREAA